MKEIIQKQIDILVEVNDKLKDRPEDYAEQIKRNAECILYLAREIRGLE